MDEQRIVRFARIILVAVCFQLLVSAGLAQNSNQFESVLIATPKPYDRVIQGVEALGGKVKYQFDFVDGVAVEIPVRSLDDLRKFVGPKALEKDVIIPHPVTATTLHDANNGGLQVEGIPHGTVALANGDSSAIGLGGPGDPYILNFAGSDIDKVHAMGFTGSGNITAVIDTGIRPGFAALGDSVIGGFDFVGDGLGFSNLANDGHGTFVATLISGKAQFNLSGSPLLKAISSYAPDSLIDGTTITFLGSAPDTQIYAVRVFGKDVNAGSRVSTIIAAIQHVIAKKREGLNIQVCNLSLGKSTLQARTDLLDKSVDGLLAEGIIPVVSAGDAGSATLTIASPGSSLSALTVGAANFARNERILRDVENGPGVGLLWRPTIGTQTAYFSSRGPNADGRPDPDVIASGFANISQGYAGTSELSIANGTSFSAPIVSGVAAILRQAFPNASATQIRNAIIASADNSLLSDGSTELDQGHGLINAKAAYDLLNSGKVSDQLPEPNSPASEVRANIESTTDLVVRGGSITDQLRDLRPGERKDLLYDIPKGTKQVVVSLNKFRASLPNTSQNALFGDDILLFVHSAKTSAFNQNGDYLVSTFTTGGRFAIDDPEPGILRVSVNADWSNAGTVSADVSVSSTLEKQIPISTAGTISDTQTIRLPIEIPKNVGIATFQLAWNHGWDRYPTNDLDLILQDPAGNRIVVGATFDSPEFASVKNPRAGSWLIIIEGFDLPTETDDFALTVTFNNKPVNY